MLIYICLSSHGYGHAARQAAILYEIHRLKPEWRLVISSTVDYRFLRLIFKGLPIEYRRCCWDVGICQSNALDVDLDLTLSLLETLQKDLPAQIDTEVKWIVEQKSNTLIIGDIPPSSSQLASKICSPLVLIGNFGWDDIYFPLGDKFKYFAELSRREYSSADILIKLPFSMQMNWGLKYFNVGLTSLKPRPLREKIKRKIESFKSPNIIIGFGGYGFKLSKMHFKMWPQYNFFIPYSYSKDFNNNELDDNIFILPENSRVVDFLPFCQRHLGKPGYSSFCEAISNNVGMHIVKRHSFAESNILINGIKESGKYCLLTEDAFNNGDWKLDKPLLGDLTNPLMKDGSVVAAKIIVKFLQDKYP